MFPFGQGQVYKFTNLKINGVYCQLRSDSRYNTAAKNKQMLL